MEKSNLVKTDRVLAAVHTKIRLLPRLQPTNLENEKRRFFYSLCDQNPRFKYRTIKPPTMELRREIKKCKTDKSPMGVLLKRKGDWIEKQIDLLESIGKRGFSEKSVRLYGRPSQNLIILAKAKIKIDEKTNANHSGLKSHRAVELLRSFLDSDRLDWTTKEAERLTSRISVDSNTRALKIKKGVLFNKKEFRCLVAHEIETHIFRHENGKNQPFKIFATGGADYLETEEGLAVYNEKKTHKLPPSSFHNQRLYLRVLAVDYALKNSFGKTFEKLLKLGISPQLAWDITFRTKRGLGDTSRPGAFTKDYLYLNGYLKIKRYLKEKKKIKDLYIGRINMDDLKLIKKIKEVRCPKHLPKIKKA